MALYNQAIKINLSSFFKHQKKPEFTLTHGKMCNIQLSKNIVLNPKDGTLMEVGQGKKEPTDIIHILEAKDRQSAGPTAPAHALMLVKYEYP